MGLFHNDVTPTLLSNANSKRRHYTGVATDGSGATLACAPKWVVVVVVVNYVYRNIFYYSSSSVRRVFARHWCTFRCWRYLVPSSENFSGVSAVAVVDSVPDQPCKLIGMSRSVAVYIHKHLRRKRLGPANRLCQHVDCGIRNFTLSAVPFFLLVAFMVIYGILKAFQRRGKAYLISVFKITSVVRWFMKLFSNETVAPDLKLYADAITLLLTDELSRLCPKWIIAIFKGRLLKMPPVATRGQTAADSANAMHSGIAPTRTGDFLRVGT